MARRISTRAGSSLLGRSEELARLGRFLGGTGGPALFVSGEAGIGKSRLIREGAQRAARSGARVLRGACFEPDRRLPYAPLIDLLRALSRTNDPPPALGPALGHLRSLLPELSLGAPPA